MKALFAPLRRAVWTRRRVRFDPQERRVDLKSGKASFDVAKDRARPFVLYAGDPTITALGTEFVVRHDAIRTAVTLMDGMASVSAEGAAEGHGRCPARHIRVPVEAGKRQMTGKTVHSPARPFFSPARG